jgi:hypothetical protein
MLQQTRFAAHFSFIGDFERHYGLFEGCGSSLPFDGGARSALHSSGSDNATTAGGSCC